MLRLPTATWQRTLLTLLIAAGILHLAYWMSAAQAPEQPLDATCAAMDHEASVGIALLVSEPTAIAEAKLDEALNRLKRARRNCRAGWTTMSSQDYRILQESYPRVGREEPTP
jgi:hypothetical protein